MEDADSFPAEILRTPQPLVAFSGLELSKPVHRRVWEVFSSNRGLDRHSLFYINLPDLHELSFPPVKPKKASYEWYIPKGILKKNWINKHQNIIPSVVVIFLELNWNDPEKEIKSRHCAERVQTLKKVLQGRGTKISVVLLQDESFLGDTDSVTSFCTECEISPRSLFVIGLKDQLLSAIIRLETNLHELSQNYYHNEIKHVRSHKDALNKSTHMLLMIRHMFKIGHLNEMKNDLHSAQKAYQTAYSLILEIRLNEFNISEYRTVAGFINYKICRLGFKLNLPREAIAHFRKHLDNFKAKTGVHELGWEHAAWQATQSAMFATLFLEVHKNGQQAIQTQHPGIYFQLAADYATSRRKLAEEQCSQITSYPDPDPLLELTEFYGQRPWRPGKLEPVDLQREKEGIEALQYKERTKTKHSQIIIRLQESALHQFDTFSSPRMKNQVEVQMAEELMIDQKYAKAMTVLIPCAEVYRREGWTSLALAALLKALKCAFLTINVEAYIQLCLQLLSPKTECADSDRVRIEQNLLLVLDRKPPPPEPSLTGKNERASVGQAARGWKERLEGLGKIAVTVPEHSVIDILPTLPKSSKIGESFSIRFSLRNHSSHIIRISTLALKFNLSEYDPKCTDPAEVELQPNSEKTLELALQPNSTDVDKILKLESLQFKTDKSDSVEYIKEFRAKQQNVYNLETKFIPRDSNIDVEYSGSAPALVGEWFDLQLLLNSKEVTDATNIEVVCWLRDGGDPLISDTTNLSIFPGYPTTPTTPGGSQPLEMLKSFVTVPVLPAGASHRLGFFLRTSTLGPRAVACQLRYSLLLNGETCVCSSFHVFEVEVAAPFYFTSTTLNLLLEETKQMAADEHFLVVPKISCSSPHQLLITESRVDTRVPVKMGKETHSLAGSELCQGFKLEQGFPAVVPHQGLFNQYDVETVHLGKFVLKWRRKSSEIINESIFELPSVKISRCFMGLRCTLPPFGVLRTPAEATYEIENKTDLVQEFSLTMDPSDAFMFSGPKQLRLKVFPRDARRVRYLLYPLLSGHLVLPRLKILPLTSGGVASLDKCGTVETIIARTLPTVFFVLPLEKSQERESVNQDYFELKEPTVIPNLPFTNCGNKAVRG